MAEKDPFTSGEGEPNPLEELLRQFGIQPGPDGRYDLAQLMGPLQQAMQQFQQHLSSFGGGEGAGGLNWGFVRDIARKVTAASGPDPSLSASDSASVRDTVGLADLWLDAHTSFGRIPAPARAWSRAEWVEHTIGTWEQLAGSISNALAGAIGGMLGRSSDADVAGMASMMEPMMRAAATGMLSAQVGQAIGQLSTDVVSASDLGFPLTEAPVVALLPTNITRFADGLDAGVDEVRLYLALRETARQRLFASAPWLGPQMLALIEHYARGITIDSTAFEEAMEAQLSGGLTPEGLEEFGSSLAGKLFQPALTPEQTEILGRLETLVAVVEGWVDDVVTQTTSTLLPSAPALQEIVRRRSASAGPAQTALKSLLNLELRPRRVRDAANVWAAVRSSRGADERDNLWAHPDLIPNAADLDDPLGFAEHGRAQTSVDDMDAELAKLLEQEGGREDDQRE